MAYKKKLKRKPKFKNMNPNMDFMCRELEELPDDMRFSKVHSWLCRLCRTIGCDEELLMNEHRHNKYDVADYNMSGYPPIPMNEYIDLQARCVCLNLANYAVNNNLVEYNNEDVFVDDEIGKVITNNSAIPKIIWSLVEKYLHNEGDLTNPNIILGTWESN